MEMASSAVCRFCTICISIGSGTGLARGENLFVFEIRDERFLDSRDAEVPELREHAAERRAEPLTNRQPSPQYAHEDAAVTGWHRGDERRRQSAAAGGTEAVRHAAALAARWFRPARDEL